MTQEELNEVHALKEEYLLRNKDWREGQAFFNALHTIDPDTAEKIRGTAYDPYYFTSKIAINYLKAI